MYSEFLWIGELYFSYRHMAIFDICCYHPSMLPQHLYWSFVWNLVRENIHWVDRYCTTLDLRKKELMSDVSTHWTINNPLTTHIENVCCGYILIYLNNVQSHNNIFLFYPILLYAYFNIKNKIIMIQHLLALLRIYWF